MGVRRIVASSVDLDSEDRLDLLVHALAQLDDDAVLTVQGDGPGRRELEKLAWAYGVGERLEFAGSAPDDGLTAYPSPRDADTTMAQLVEALSGLEPAPPRPPAAGELAGQRVALVTNVITHYRAPLFNQVHEHLAAAGATFKVFVLAAGDETRPWMEREELRFPYEVLEPLRLPGVGRLGPMPANLGRALGAYRPSMVAVGGFAPLVSGRVARYCRRAGVPFGIWSGEIRSRDTARSKLRRRQRRALVRRARFALAYGFESAEYLREIAPELPVCYVRNTTRIAEPIARPRSTSTVEVLTVARAVPGKGLESLVDTFELLRDLPCRLTVVGDGPALPALEERARDNPAVRFVGALTPERVLAELQAADVFAFPSRFDVFGLVLVEAMGAGLATVLTRAPGAAADLAVDEVNCLLVEDTPDAWARALRRLVGEPELRARLGAAAARTIRQRWTLEHSAATFASGLRLGAKRLDEVLR